MSHAMDRTNKGIDHLLHHVCPLSTYKLSVQTWPTLRLYFTGSFSVVHIDKTPIAKEDPNNPRWRVAVVLLEREVGWGCSLLESSACFLWWSHLVRSSWWGKEGSDHIQSGWAILRLGCFTSFKFEKKSELPLSDRCTVTVEAWLFIERERTISIVSQKSGRASSQRYIIDR